MDKTELIACTNELIGTKDKFACVSRPRRFGKSMALKMLAAYYSRGCDSADLFRGLKIESYGTFQEHLNQYDVIYLNMQQFLIEAASGKATEYLEQEVLEELAKEYGEILKGRKTGLAAALRKIYVETERQFVFLVDEWDCIMRERQESEALQKQYLDYDSEAEEAFIPNKEIMGEFENAMSVGGWPEIMKVLRASERLLEDTFLGNAQRVAEGLDQAHNCVIQKINSR